MVTRADRLRGCVQRSLSPRERARVRGVPQRFRHGKLGLWEAFPLILTFSLREKGLLTPPLKTVFLALAALAAVMAMACGQGPQPAASGFSVVQAVPAEPVELVGEGDTASPPPSNQTQPSGAYGFSHYFFEQVGDEVIATLVEGPAGEQVRSNLSYQQLKQLYDQGGPPPDELKMTREELGELVGQLDTVRQATEKYQDVEVALGDGYFESPEQFPNMGAHFLNPKLMNDGLFNPEEPEFLLYIRDAAEDWELVGSGFILPKLLAGEDHPEAFAGPLDNWHVHYSLCAGGRGNTRSATPEECQEQQGVWLPSFGWMIHTYVWVDNPLGVFGMWNPNIPPLLPPAQMRENRSVEALYEDGVATTIENFSHRNAQVKAGETLVWTNMDSAPHTVTLGSRGVAEPGFDSGAIGPGQSFALRIDKPGTYSFTCTLHPAMTASIVVSE